MLTALIHTCIIEAAVTFVIVCIRGFKDNRRMIFYNLLCNMLTNPLLNLSLFGAARLGAGHTLIMIMIAVGEICVVISEYGLYRLMSSQSRSFCLILSLVTNVVSYLAGLIIQ